MILRKRLENIMRKESDDDQHFPFPTVFATPQTEMILFLARIELWGANALTNSLIQHFETTPNSKKLQTTTEMWLLEDFKI